MLNPAQTTAPPLECPADHRAGASDRRKSFFILVSESSTLDGNAALLRRQSHRRAKDLRKLQQITGTIGVTTALRRDALGVEGPRRA
jgi:hypothetical protein